MFVMFANETDVVGIGISLFVSAIFLIFIEYVGQSNDLINIPYTKENRYLFRKYIFIQDLFIGLVIA